MTELEISNNPDATTVEEVVVAYLAVAASNPGTESEASALAVETIEAWRKLRLVCGAVAAAYGVTMSQPIGWEPAHRVFAEATPYLQAELAATR